MRILYPNLLTADNAHGTGWDEANPLSNLVMPNLNDAAVSTNVTPQLDIDFGQARTVSGFAIIGHNLGASDSVTLTLATNSAFTSGVLTHPMTLRNSNWSDGLHYVQYRAFDAVERRYARVSFSGVQNVVLGALWIGDHIQLTPAARLPFTVDHDSRDALVESTLGRVTGDRGTVLRSVTLDFPKSDKATVEEVRKLHYAVGRVMPFVIVYSDTGGGVAMPMYCRITQFEESISLPKPEYRLRLQEGR